MTPNTRRTSYERARRPGERADRRAQILIAARTLIAAGEPPQRLTVSGIAREAGLSAAGIYTYFDAKESILLDVLADDLEAWLGAVAAELEAIRQPTVDRVAGIVVDNARRSAALAPLLVALSATLESTAGSDDVATFKRRGAKDVERTARALERALPGIDGDAAMRYLRALLIGLWSFAMPSSPSAVTDRGRLEAAQWFHEQLREAIAAMLRGLTPPPEPATT